MAEGNYYTAVELDGLFLGWVYRVLPGGEEGETLWVSPRRYDTRAEALAAAAGWLGEQGMDAEVG